MDKLNVGPCIPVPMRLRAVCAPKCLEKDARADFLCLHCYPNAVGDNTWAYFFWQRYRPNNTKYTTLTGNIPKIVFPRSNHFFREKHISSKRMFPWHMIFLGYLPGKNLCLKRTYSAKVSFLPTNHIFPNIVFARKRYLREDNDSPNMIFARA